VSQLDAGDGGRCTGAKSARDYTGSQGAPILS